MGWILFWWGLLACGSFGLGLVTMACLRPPQGSHRRPQDSPWARRTGREWEAAWREGDAVDGHLHGVRWLAHKHPNGGHGA